MDKTSWTYGICFVHNFLEMILLEKKVNHLLEYTLNAIIKHYLDNIFSQKICGLYFKYEKWGSLYKELDP